MKGILTFVVPLFSSVVFRLLLLICRLITLLKNFLCSCSSSRWFLFSPVHAYEWHFKLLTLKARSTKDLMVADFTLTGGCESAWMYRFQCDWAFSESLYSKPSYMVLRLINPGGFPGLHHLVAVCLSFWPGRPVKLAETSENQISETSELER